MADYGEIAALWEAADLPPRRFDAREEIAKKLTRDPDLFLVYREDGRIVGTVIGGWDGRRGWVYRMAVHPDCQRKGIGSALMRELERRFREKGALAVNLIYNLQNPKSSAFYPTLGYTPRPVAVMGKDLEPRPEGEQ